MASKELMLKRTGRKFYGLKLEQTPHSAKKSLKTTSSPIQIVRVAEQKNLRHSAQQEED